MLALVVLTTSSAAHLLGGGALPGAAVMTALGAVVALASWGLTRWRLGRTATAGVLAVSQVGLHEALMHLAMAGTGAPSSSAMAGASAAGAAGAGWVMLACHAAATAVLALLLGSGERALWALWGWLLPLVVAALVLVGAAVLPGVRRRERRWATAPVRCRRAWVAQASRRGPPPPGLLALPALA